MSEGPGETLPNNFTRAHVVGKVPSVIQRSRKRGKSAKLSASGKRHAGQMAKRGLISPSAAVQNGIAGGAAKQ